MKITSREAAKKGGLTRYFTGEPCKRGHVSQRKTSSATCVECDHLAYHARKGSLLSMRQRNRNLKSRYSIDLNEYVAMDERQGGRCAICDGLPKKLVVDHDHEANRTRGLLCIKCNAGLGQFNDNLVILQRAVDYLVKHV